jgi:hypothetical protein
MSKTMYWQTITLIMMPGPASTVAGLRSGDGLKPRHGEPTKRQHVIAVTLLDLQNLIDTADGQEVGGQGVVDAADKAGHKRSHDSPTSIPLGYLVCACRLQASQKKASPNCKRTTLKPTGMASTLKS